MTRFAAYAIITTKDDSLAHPDIDYPERILIDSRLFGIRKNSDLLSISDKAFNPEIISKRMKKATFRRLGTNGRE